MSEIVKVCKIHGGLTKENVYPRPNRPSPECKACKNNANKKWHKKSNRKQRWNSEWFKSYKNRPEIRDAINSRRRKYVKNLKDLYIKKQILKKKFYLKSEDIPDEFIKAYKSLMLLRRKIKEIKNGNKKC